MQDVHRSALLSLLLAAATELSGTRPDVLAQTPPSTPTFPSGVDVITVDAVVVDGKGRPVSGLAREDFVVMEDGRPQEIVTFEAVEAGPAPTPSEPDEPAAVATSRPSSGPGREFAVLLDDVWIPPLDGPNVREALTAFLTRSLRAGDQVTLANTSGDLQWSGRIPEGREDLLAVVTRFSGRGPAQEVFVDASGALRTMSEAQAERVGRGTGPGSQGIAREIDARRRQRMGLTHAALRRQLEAFSSGRGRKSLIVFTRGSIRDAGPELGETTRIAHEANVAIHFLDLGDLKTTPGYSADIGGAPDPSTVAASILDQDVFDTAGSQDLAADTGGFSVRNTNDLSAGLDRIAAESRIFYLLGIHPPPGKPPREWRKLRVTVRTSGLTVRARRGYAIWPASDRVRSTPAASIPMRLASYVLEPVDPENTRVAVAIEVDASTLPSVRERGALRPILRVAAVPRDGSTTHTGELALHRDDELAAGRWESTRLDLVLPRDVYAVRAEIEDPATGRRGVVEQRVVVPEQALFRTSTPVLSDALMPASGPGAPVPAPVAHRRFSAADGRALLLAFAVLGAASGPAADGPDVRFRLTVKDPSDRVLIETSDAAVTPSADGRLEQVVGLPLAQMAAGEYELELAVQDRVAGTVVERKETFVVEAPPARVEPVVPTAATAPDVATILERAAEYVIAYQTLFSDLIAREDYEQRFSSRNRQGKRRSRADMLFVSLPGPIPWAGFRDVYEVDGQKVHDREGRLERLFRDSPDGAVSAASQAQSILDESTRFNLGPVRRTVNIPTFALLVLHPGNQHRFAFERAGHETIDGTRTVEIAFTERARPTIVAGAEGGDVPSQGRLWIDAEQGTVLRTEIAYGGDVKDKARRKHTRIVTEYGREPRLRVRVPVRMSETYEWGADAARDSGSILTSGFSIKTVARYSGYRRFEVTTDERYTTPPEQDR